MLRHLLALLSTVLLLTMLAPGVLAYEDYRDTGGGPGCVDCHPDFLSRGPLHDLHVGNNQMTNTCGLCHDSTGDIPKTYTSSATGGEGCRGCHGLDNGTTFNWAAGLRLHHANAGAPTDSNGDVCADCHNDPAPLPESTIPVYYLRSDVNVKDPCSSVLPDGEDYDSDGKGIDNDGDLVYDENDPDCGFVGVDEGTSMPPLNRLLVYPNPVIPGQTEIQFVLPSASEVSVQIYDQAGRMVLSKKIAPGHAGVQRIPFTGLDGSGRSLASGVYFVRVEGAGELSFGRIVMLR